VKEQPKTVNKNKNMCSPCKYTIGMYSSNVCPRRTFFNGIVMGVAKYKIFLDIFIKK
jgi:hypothetical protein